VQATASINHLYAGWEIKSNQACLLTLKRFQDFVPIPTTASWFVKSLEKFRLRPHQAPKGLSTQTNWINRLVSDLVDFFWVGIEFGILTIILNRIVIFSGKAGAYPSIPRC
jgi:hypothetical protein